MKKGNKVINTKYLLGYTIGNYYTVILKDYRRVWVMNDHKVNNIFYLTVNENEVFSSLFDYFGSIKDLRKEKLKKLKYE